MRYKKISFRLIQAYMFFNIFKDRFVHWVEGKVIFGRAGVGCYVLGREQTDLFARTRQAADKIKTGLPVAAAFAANGAKDKISTF